MFIAVKQGPVCTQLFYVCASVIELYYLTVIYAVSAACADMKTTDGGRRGGEGAVSTRASLRCRDRLKLPTRHARLRGVEPCHAQCVLAARIGPMNGACAR
jgi:hypothetical protein